MAKTIKKTLALFLSVVMLIGVLPMGYSFADYYAGYDYSRSGSEATITGYSGSDTELVIPEKVSVCTVVAINEAAFYGKNTITSVTMPDSLKIIGDGAFYNCTLLETVTLGGEITTIGSNIFKNCVNLTTINYKGTAEQWAAIIGSNNLSDNVTVNFNYGYDCVADGHILGSAVEATTASCTENGNIAYWTCEICQKKFSDATLETEVADVIIPAAHSWVDANCTTAKTCSVCGATDGESLGHTEREIPAENATCTEAGSTAGLVCDVCGVTIREVEAVPATGHNYIKDEEKSTAATCTKEGIDYTVCANCGDVKTKKVKALGHKKETIVEAVAPTCTQDGKTKAVACLVCNSVFEASVAVPATGHNYIKDEEKSTAPTCTKEGIDYIVCANCGDVKRNKVKALGHKKEVIVEAIAPTCTQDGKTKAVACLVCNSVFEASVAVPATGHTEKIIPAVPATCLTDGSTEGKKCSVCDAVIVAVETVPALGHSYTWTEITAATCTAEGSERGVCSACNDTVTRAIAKVAHNKVTNHSVEATCLKEGYFGGIYCTSCEQYLEPAEVIPALGHNFVKDEEISFDATCIDTGRLYETCSRCEVARDTEIPVVEHSYSENWMIILPANCTERGSQIKICRVCTAVKSEVIPATGHNVVIDEGTAADCENAGLSEGKHCSVCEEVLVEQETVAALGHSWANATCTAPKTCSTCGETEGGALGHSFTNYVSDGNATCLEDGTKTAKCDRCDIRNTLADADSKLGHSFTNYVSDGNATCLEDGTKTAKCDRCDVRDTLADADSKLGHSFTNYASDGNATCLADGTKTAKCDRCDVRDTLADADSKLGHSFTNYVSDGNATCLADGTKTAKCDRCDVTDTLADADSKLGHSFTNYVSNGDATCTEDGTKTAKCDRCDVTDTLTDTDSKLGHTEVTIEAIEATCTETGLTAGKMCTVCDEITVPQEEVPATGHDYISVDAQAPTCTVIGWDEFIFCLNCSDTTYEEIEATGHTEKIIPGVAATCTETGLSDIIVCEVCEITLEYQVETDALGHDFVIDEEISKAATCTEKGVEKFDCSRCDESYKNELDATGHAVTNWVVSEVATCDKEGLLIGRCNNCYAVLREKADKIAHADADADNKCDVCGTKLTADDPKPDPDPVPDPVPDEECSCYCHKAGILRFFLYDIPLIFYKLIGINKTCACGAAHY